MLRPVLGPDEGALFDPVREHFVLLFLVSRALFGDQGFVEGPKQKFGIQICNKQINTHDETRTTTGTLTQ